MNNLRKLRKERGLTLKELGCMTNISFQLLSSIEREARNFTQEILGILCDYFNVSTDYMLGRSTERKPINNELKSRLMDLVNNLSDAEINEIIKYTLYIRSKHNEK